MREAGTRARGRGPRPTGRGLDRGGLEIAGHGYRQAPDRGGTGSIGHGDCAHAHTMPRAPHVRIAGTALENGLRREGLVGFSQSLQSKALGGSSLYGTRSYLDPSPAIRSSARLPTPAHHN